MPFLKAILLLLAAGSSGSVFCNGLPGHQPANSESHQATVRNMAPRDPVEGERTVAQEDRKRLAEKAIAEGKLFESEKTADSLRKALASYEKALEIWRSLGDRRAEALTLQYLGIVHYLLDERQKALDIFQQELQLWRAEGDGPQQAQALNNIGVIYGALGLGQKAIESYQQALPFRRAAGDRSGLATTLDNIGMFHLNGGELQKALDQFTQALTLYRELNERLTS